MEHLNELRVDAVTGRRVIARCAPALAPSEYRVDKHEKKSQTEDQGYEKWCGNSFGVSPAEPRKDFSRSGSGIV